MNLSLPPGWSQRLLSNLPGQLPSWHCAVNCVWVFSCFCFSSGCSTRWEVVGLDFILPARGTGEEVPGEEGFRPFLPEASPRVEAEVFRVRACEVEAVVGAQDVPIN